MRAAVPPPAMSPRPIALFIPDLSRGGSERQLVALARGLAAAGRPVLIITMYGGGGLLDEAQAIPGIRVTTLAARRPWTRLARLAATLRRDRVDVLYAFLSTAQAYALAAKCLMPRTRVVLRIGDAIPPGGFPDRRGRIANAIVRLLSVIPNHLVFNSHAAVTAKRLHAAADRVSVILNGIDTDRFRPDAAARTRHRQRLGVPDDAPVVGCVATFSVYKDHATFIAAAARVHAELPQAVFLAIGDDRTGPGVQAHAQVTATGLDGCFRFLGSRADVQELLPACDVGCLSSRTEGFPNAIGEFMACGVPCVATDVGDSALLVGDAGRVVPAGDPAALARALLAVLRLPESERRALGQRARARVVERFSVDRMIGATEAVLARA